MEIKGSVAVITGGGNGIGEAIAKYFVTHGAKVVIVDMAQKHIDRVLGEIKAMGGEAIGVQASVTSEADTARFYQAALEAFGKINIVVSCAGIIRDEFGVAWVRLKLSKPGAVTGARNVGVLIERGTRPA